MNYTLSIVLIAKDEESYLEEFVSYHHLLGVDHFYIYDNESTTPIKEVLKNYADLCTIVDYPGTAAQYSAYTHFCKTYGSQTAWAAFIDTDEFIVLRNQDSVIDFINEYKSADAIGLNWVYFGDSYHETKPEGLVIDNFTLCQPGQNNHIKTIAKPGSIESFGNAHFITMKPGSIYTDVKRNRISGPFNDNEVTDVAQINHYFSKSKEECIKRYSRKKADTGAVYELTEETLEAWRNSLNQREDLFIKNKYAEAVKEMILKRKEK
ncbi:MAG: glycosyltransferase family 2 protein [Lacibacter sp.]